MTEQARGRQFVTDPTRARDSSSGLGALEDLALAVRELRDELRAGLADLSKRVDALGPVSVAAQPARPQALTVAAACKAFAIGRSTFDRWLADTTTGLREVVLQPSGPRGRVLVPVDAFEAWMRARSR